MGFGPAKREYSVPNLGAFVHGGNTLPSVLSFSFFFLVIIQAGAILVVLTLMEFCESFLFDDLHFSLINSSSIQQNQCAKKPSLTAKIKSNRVPDVVFFFIHSYNTGARNSSCIRYYFGILYFSKIKTA